MILLGVGARARYGEYGMAVRDRLVGASGVDTQILYLF